MDQKLMKKSFLLRTVQRRRHVVYHWDLLRLLCALRRVRPTKGSQCHPRRVKFWVVRPGRVSEDSDMRSLNHTWESAMSGKYVSPCDAATRSVQFARRRRRPYRHTKTNQQSEATIGTIIITRTGMDAQPHVKRAKSACNEYTIASEAPRPVNAGSRRRPWTALLAQTERHSCSRRTSQQCGRTSQNRQTPSVTRHCAEGAHAGRSAPGGLQYVPGSVDERCGERVV
eukprot:1522957-Amphidinium_carterae.1